LAAIFRAARIDQYGSGPVATLTREHVQLITDKKRTRLRQLVNYWP